MDGEQEANYMDGEQGANYSLMIIHFLNCVFNADVDRLLQRYSR